MTALRDLLSTTILAACAGVLAQAFGWSPRVIALRVFGVTMAARTAYVAVRDHTGSEVAALVALLAVALTVDMLLYRVTGESDD